MRVLVTGATGYLGRAIVAALARQGHAPTAFARRASQAGLPGAAVDGDIRDEPAVRQALRGVDGVCHTAALVSLWRPRPAEFDEVNVGGTAAVLRACEAHGIARIVYTSSFLALPPGGRGAPLAANDYQRTKVRARELVRGEVRRGLPIVTLDPGVIYGPGEATEGNLVGRLVRDHLAGRLPGVVGGDRVWSYAHVDDVADAHVRALERAEPGDEFALGGENAPQMRVFEIVRQLTGRALPRRIPYAVAAMAALVDEARARISGRPPRITRGAVAIFRHDWTLESDRAASRLGYRVTPLAEGVAHVVRSLRESR